ncbi:MAG: hypothetical protein NC548_54580 [Lachnospiraceae bacterium]|nr:hypothetical protein [Acetatifactor muris]MCM1223511.1 hypothetical protein [Lachnospiraceae bacterium]MCM1560327.1 hypothetical protein [Butyrivibrio sp.]
MTSKHCFFRMMREDFRHKLWMLALSVLGNMLAFPVVYLLAQDRYGVSVQSLTYRASNIGEFFGYGVMISGGIVAVAGALIVGLSGFRYVFHRNMTDTYHSIPVKRRTLFGVSWLNGFLIWFLPCMASMGITLLLGLGQLRTLKRTVADMALNEKERLLVSYWPTGAGLAIHALLSMLVLTLVFLLVYHLVILAVMLCGNILNTLVTMGTIGIGVYVIYALFISFCQVYFDTFLYTGSRERVGYASPLVSAVILLWRRGLLSMYGETAAFAESCILNLVMALALGALAFLAYLKRPSELAEQGLGLKPLRFVMQVPVTLAAVLAGWLLFYELGNGLAWGVFGGLLAGIVTFGVMDIVFRMEFRAFFAHRVLMGVTVAAGIFTGLLFYYDWPGYDRYLPEEEKIAEISLYGYKCSNWSGANYDIEDDAHRLNRVHIRDSAGAYEFLQSVAGRASEKADDMSVLYDRECTEEIFVRVTLNSGRAYYRRYQVSSLDSDPACALLTTPEYLDVNFRLEDESCYDVITLCRERFNRELRGDTDEGRRLIAAVCEAYNRDLEEHPEAFIRGEGRLFCAISLDKEETRDRRRYLEVFEGMEHTREALRQQGFGWLADPVSEEAVREIRLELNYSVGYTGDLVEAARELYGVAPGEDSGETSIEKAGETAQDMPVAAETYSASTYEAMYEDMYALCITDKAEIRELLELISYEYGKYYTYGGAFRPGYADVVTIVLTEEEESEMLSVFIPLGALPEKYILRFGTLQ